MAVSIMSSKQLWLPTLSWACQQSVMDLERGLFVLGEVLVIRGYLGVETIVFGCVLLMSLQVPAVSYTACLNSTCHKTKLKDHGYRKMACRERRADGGGRR